MDVGVPDTQRWVETRGRRCSSQHVPWGTTAPAGPGGPRMPGAQFLGTWELSIEDPCGGAPSCRRLLMRPGQGLALLGACRCGVKNTRESRPLSAVSPDRE